MKNKFPEQLRYLVDHHYDGNWSNLSRKVGISKTTLQRIKKGSGGTTDTFLRVCSATGVNLEWLLIGSGSMFVSSGSSLSSDYVLIPRLDVEASAGGGAFNLENAEVIEHIPFTVEFLQSKFHRAALSYPDYLKIIKVIGDSMLPTIADGDLVMLDISCGGLAVDGIYGFLHDGRLKVKRLRFLKNGIEVSSDNMLYSPEELSKSDLEEYNFKILGPIRWIGRILLR